MYQVARVGEIMPTGMFKEVWNSGKVLKPEPYSKYISNMMCDWPKGLVKRK
jgi:urea transport system substrate-binding protein